MSGDNETLAADIRRAQEVAANLFQFARAVRPDCDFGVGWTIGESLACLIEDHGEPADLAWLIQILGDCIGELAEALREEHLAKCDGQ